MSSTVKQITVVALIVVVVVVVVIIGIRTLGKLAKSVSTTKTSTANQTEPTTNEDKAHIDLVEPKTKYSGKIAFTATVDEILGVRAFVVKSNDLFNQKMLIITEDGIAPIGAESLDEYLIKKGDRLVITGRLEELTATTPNRKSLNIKLDNLTEWMNKPVVVASDLDRVK